ncbi:MAG: carbon-nitrogen hydrolase family protein [Pseudomonadota bacterium]
MTKFAIAGLQLELNAGDNVEAICHEIRVLKTRFPWVQMAIFGELGAFGPNPRLAQEMPGPAEAAFAAVARETGLWLIPGSLYETLNDAVYNTTPVINPRGEIVARYRKMFPFLPYEKGVAPGTEFVTFDIDGVGRFGVSICYDMHFPETTRAMACAGAEVILHPTLTNTIDRDAELAIARANAAMNQLYFVDINCAGRLGYGRSIIAGPGGEVIHQAGPGREIIPAELDFDYVRRVRERGWQGLGQQLKSFRDGALALEDYGSYKDSEFLKSLGALKTPGEEE